MPKGLVCSGRSQVTREGGQAHALAMSSGLRLTKRDWLLHFHFTTSLQNRALDTGTFLTTNAAQLLSLPCFVSQFVILDLLELQLNMKKKGHFTCMQAYIVGLQMCKLWGCYDNHLSPFQHELFQLDFDWAKHSISPQQDQIPECR